MNAFVINKFILLRNVAVLCMLGNMLYFFFPFPAIVWRLAFVFLSVYCVFEDKAKFGLSKLEKAIVLFVLLNVVYFFVSYLWLIPSTTQIGNTLYALLAYVMFAFLGKKGMLTSKFVTIVSVLLVIAAIPSFYHAQQIALAKLVGGGDDTTTNASVLFVMFLPMLFLVQNRSVSLVLFCICLFFLVAGAKRGNIVSAIMPAMLYMFVLYKESVKSLPRLLLFVIIVLGIILWAKGLILEDEYLLSRYEDTLEGNSSGRDEIYLGMWKVWTGANNLTTYFLGYGYDGTIHSIMHKRAHNDWLEILVDFGILGITCYVFVFVALVRFYFSLHKGLMRYVLLSIIFVWFSKTLYSMGFTDESLALMAIPLGCLYDKNWLK